MSTKVYDLAKEYGIQSKDFVVLLQQANIPVKNHMSTLTEQQEKYFRNNFTIAQGQLSQLSTEDKAAAVKKEDKPQAQKPPSQQRQQPSQQRASQQRPQGYTDGAQRAARHQTQRPQAQQNYSDTQGGYNRSSRPQGQQAAYNRPARPQGQGQGYNRDNRPQGQQAAYNRSVRPQGQGQGYNRDNRPQGQGYNRGARPAQPGAPAQGGNRPLYGQNRGPASPRPAPVEKPLEKSKIDKTKKDFGKRNDQHSKAKDNLFSDTPARRPDNTKRTHGSKSAYRKKKLAVREEKLTSGVTGLVVLPETMTVSELAEKVLIAPSEIIKILMSYGIMANINQTVDFETAAIVCEELQIDTALEEETDIFDVMRAEHFENEGELKSRPPIITVMGHVDHGKTSLLDAIRHTNVISGEAGGITQHVGAYTVSLNGKPITFIDTPGHEAFTAMRSRGASVTDIAVLVIAADDGIKPQTVEAINHAKAAKVPIVVALNKIDKADANPDRVKQELTEYELVPEDWGGNTICAPVSAKSGEGLDNLLEMILLVAEVEDLKANYEKPAIGTVIEARIDKQRGVTATLLVGSGVLRDGDIIVAGKIYGKVRAMTDDNGQRIETAGPSFAAEIIGLGEVPAAGDKFIVAENEKEARQITERRKDRQRLLETKAVGSISLDEFFSQIAQGERKQIELIVKADVQGSFEAIKQSLEKLNDNEDGITVSVIHGGVGAVSETDITLAAASKALVIAFNVRPDNAARLAAQKEGVEIRAYRVIYDLLDEIEAAMKGMRDPEFKEVVTGTAEVRQLIKVPNMGMIGGCYVTDGVVQRNSDVRVVRGGAIIYTSKISSLRRFKDDVREVASGYECGIGVERYNDLKEGDMLEFFKMEEIEQ